MNSRSSAILFSAVVAASCVVVLWLCQSLAAQAPSGRQQTRAEVNYKNPLTTEGPSSAQETSEREQAEAELRKGTALTSKGLFSEAIPHLLAARGRVSNDYAASFNLALSYVGTHDFKQALHVLDDLRRAGHDGADVENLLAQAYLGNGQPTEAFAALQRAAAITPQNEKLYLFVAEACMDHQDYALGLKLVDMGLRNLPQSARLHYERGLLLSQLDEFDRAKEDFQLAAQLASGNEIGYLSAAHEKLLEGNIPEALRVARGGVSQGFQNPVLLTILGEALLRSGVSPDQPDFVEAQSSLEKAVAERPNDPSSQIALGQIYLMAGRLDDAISHLEKARQMKPGQPSVYANLAKAYRRRGDLGKAQDALATLAQLNQAQAERIRSAPGDRKMSYGGSPGRTAEEAEPHR
jgi:tetratricopeptide (TPR) repeat protein